jgi:hypothetical protein
VIDRFCKSLVHCDVTSNICGEKNLNYCFKWGNLLYKLVSSTNLGKQHDLHTCWFISLKIHYKNVSEKEPFSPMEMSQNGRCTRK